MHCTFRTYGSRSPGSWDSLSSSSTTALVHALNVTGCPSTRTFIASPQEMFAHLASKCGFVAKTAYRDSAMAMVNSRFGFADGGFTRHPQMSKTPQHQHLHTSLVYTLYKWIVMFLENEQHQKNKPTRSGTVAEHTIKHTIFYISYHIKHTTVE